MLFQIDPTWEVDSPFVNQIVAPNFKLYPLVELSCNTLFFIVRVLPDNLPFWRTFLIDSIDLALSLITREEIEEHQISLFIPLSHASSSEDTICTIKEILTGLDPEGKILHLYVCENGIRYIERNLVNPNDDLSDMKSIYRNH